MLHPAIIGAFESKKEIMQAQRGLQTVVSYDKKVSSNYGRQAIVTVKGADFIANTTLHQEVFGPFSMIVQCKNESQLEEIIIRLEGQLTGTALAEDEELEKYEKIVNALQNRVGRIIFNGVPTGVEVCTAMVHGGPYPASTDSRFTAVGINSIKRWVRPISFQSWPDAFLPDALKNENPLGISRYVDGKQTKD
jgi:NADP-dependent aldehyde dehydrogenase